MDKPRFIDSYDYDPNTGEYWTKGVAEYEKSIDDYIIAPHSTLIAPPTDIPEFTVPCFNQATQEWELRFDYRRKAVGDHYEGGKPYYDPSDYWWAKEQYMTTIGNKPADMSWQKMERPTICQYIVDLESQIADAKDYLSETDYIHNVIAEEPDKADKYALVIEERKKVRASIDPKQTAVNSYKVQIASQYGEEALNHLRG